jgi:hypothetical protein
MHLREQPIQLSYAVLNDMLAWAENCCLLQMFSAIHVYFMQ